MKMSIDEMTPDSKDEMRRFCQQIEDTLKTCQLGYANLAELADHIFEDNGIDVFRQSQEFGFNNFEEFLRSDYMQGHIDIDDSDDIPSFHFPLEKIEQQKAKQQNEVSFLDFEANRKINERGIGFRRTGCQNTIKLLSRRFYKRRGLSLPEHLKPTVRKTPTGRGGFGSNSEGR